MARRPSCLLAALLGALPLACSPGEAPQLQDRYVRRFRPFEEVWRRESEISSAPQRYPAMVIWEVSNYPPASTPTPQQQRAADELVERCRSAAATHGWYDYEKARADGFDQSDDERHYENETFMLDDAILDCDRPEYLMYYPREDGVRELVGFMFFARTATERGPQIGGPLTTWHFHQWSKEQCALNEVLLVGWAVDGSCEEGVPTHRSAEMLHLWLIDRPDGPFSTSMYLEEYLDLQGLDQFVVAPEGDDLELFTARLEAAIDSLEDEDRRLVSQAVSYLIFAFGKGLTEKGEMQVEPDVAGDPETRGRMGLLRTARRRGSQMRLRHYVSLAFELDQVRPELWTEYERIHGTQETHATGHH